VYFLSGSFRPKTGKTGLMGWTGVYVSDGNLDKMRGPRSFDGFGLSRCLGFW
jgi:hypothetical protein